MACGIKLATALVACLAIANAVRVPFPQDKVVTYKYVGDVKAGTIEPAPYASEFGISAYLHLKQDKRDAAHPNTFIAALSNVESGVYNGVSNVQDGYEVYDNIPEAAKIIEHPFAIVYDDLGRLLGVRINHQEPGWSKNMKKAIASMFNVDLHQLDLATLTKPKSFIANEITIYGNCSANYEVHPVHGADHDFTVTKFTSPKDCSDYKVWEFDHVEYEGCDLHPEHSYDMGSRKVFKASKVGDNVLIKSLSVYGHVNRFLWRGRSEAHYILNNATFTLEEDHEAPAFADFDLNNVALSTDVSYGKLHSTYDEETDFDVTQGRHELRAESLVSRAEKMLNQAVDYLEENHVVEEEPSYKKGQLINRFARMLKVMKPQYIHELYNKIVEGKTDRDEVLKRLFLESVVNVGTHASTLFIRDLVLQNKLHYLMMLEILGKMPLNVRNPNVELLNELEPMLKKDYFVAPKEVDPDFDDEEVKPRVLEDIAKPVFLSFATLVYRAHKHLSVEEQQQALVLNKYIDFFYDYFVRAEYDGKVTALQALRNIQLGKVYQVLVPVVRKEVQIEGFTEELRLHAIWAVDKAIPDYQHAYDLLWPVMVDYSLPLKVRIAAYDILVRKPTTTANMMQIHWFMAYEKNPQFYNYHYTTLKSLANSVDPCNTYLQELATHCLRFTKIRPQPFYGMSSSFMVDSVDPIYGHGEGFLVSYVAHERTGFPEVLTVENIVVEGRRRHSFWKLQVILKNMDQVTKGLADLFGWKFPLNNTEVLNVLKEARGDYKTSKIFFDVVFSHNGRVTFADNYNGRNHPLGDVALELFLKFQARDIRMNHQFINHEVNDEVHLVGELGIPVLVTNKIPKVFSIRRHLFELNSTHTEEETDLRFWRHGEYSLATYNPLLGTWHVVQRLTATDIQLPTKAIDISHSSSSVLEGIVFRLPANKHSTAGFVTHAKDSVDIIESDGKVLHNFCESCEKHQVVIIGAPVNVYEPESYDSKSLGLRFHAGMFDCENGMSPVTLEKESWRAFSKERKNSWGEEIVDTFLSFRQDFKNILLSPKMGSCGLIAKVEPSKKYPTSYINYLLKANTDTIEDPSVLYAFKGNKVNVRGTYKTFGFPNNETVSTWDLHLDATLKPGHKEQSFNLQLTRTVPGEKNLKICVDGQKTHPELAHPDFLKVNANEEKTHAKLTFSMAETDGDQCSKEGTLIQVNLKGELSDEQKEQFVKDEESGDCVDDKKNELYTTTQDFTPLTPKCLTHAIKYTTLRNYLINIHYSKVPEIVSDVIRSMEDEEIFPLMPHLVYDKERSEEGHIKIALNYSMDTDTTDISVVTPKRSFKIIDLNVVQHENLFDPPGIDGFGVNPDKYLWHFLLDNSRFTTEYLQEYMHGRIKLCSIYPKALITADSGELTHELTDKWTLASGDYVDEMYAVFVKSVNNVMGLKVYAKESWIEFAPHNNEYSLKINGHEVNPSSVTNGTLVPDSLTERWVFKMTSYGASTYIELRDRPVTIIYSPTNVALLLENELQGKIAGLCGHLDGTHKTTVPKEYYLIHV